MSCFFLRICNTCNRSRRLSGQKMALDKMVIKQKIRNDIQSRFHTHNNDKANEKKMMTRNSRIFKSNFYIYTWKQPVFGRNSVLVDFIEFSIKDYCLYHFDVTKSMYQFC